MSQTERIYRINQLVSERRVVSRDVLIEQLGISLATLKRDLAYMRDRLNAPIIFDSGAGGYRFDKASIGGKYELPGLWLTPAEIHALLVMRQLIGELSPGLLSAQLGPLLSKMCLLLGGDTVPIDSFEKRIRIQRLNARHFEQKHFIPVATGVVQRRCLRITHHNKLRDETSSRIVSPQRLTYHRENWYLDAWCHMRGELRSFGLSGILSVEIVDEDIHDVASEELARLLDSGYGIFAGEDVEWAELVFSSERARWIAQEVWHAEQESWFDEEGRYHLRFPYSDPREVSMDILRHVPEVSVAAPASLKELIHSILQEGLQKI